MRCLCEAVVAAHFRADLLWFFTFFSERICHPNENHPNENFVIFSLSKPNFFFSFHSTSFSLLGTESCWKEGTNSLPEREKSDKTKACEAFLCRMTSCKNTTVCWKVTVEMASWEWVGEGYVYYLLMTSRSSLLSLWVLKKTPPFFNCLLCRLNLGFKNHAVLILILVLLSVIKRFFRVYCAFS